MRLRDGRYLDENVVERVLRRLSREDFRVGQWMPAEKDLAAKEIAEERFHVQIRIGQTDGDAPSFHRLWLGGRGGLRPDAAYWARVDAEEVSNLPFLLDRLVAVEVLALVEHLDSITEPGQ